MTVRCTTRFLIVRLLVHRNNQFRHFNTSRMPPQRMPTLLASSRVPSLHFYAFESGPGPQNDNDSLPLCWYCGKTVRQRVDRVLCAHCRRLQPLPARVDYFAYLGIAEPHALADADDAELKRRFRHMQSLVHPDKFAGRDPHEQRLSEQHSTYLNNAYRTLRDPFARADYLLGLLEQVKADGEDATTAAFDEEGTVEDTAEATEMMELMESIERLTPPQTEATRAEVARRARELDAEIYALLRHAHTQMSDRLVGEARVTLRRISYLRRARRLLDARTRRGDDNSNDSGGTSERWGGEHD